MEITGTFYLGIRTQVLTLVWQVLYPLSHLPNLLTGFLGCSFTVTTQFGEGQDITSFLFATGPNYVHSRRLTMIPDFIVVSFFKTLCFILGRVLCCLQVH